MRDRSTSSSLQRTSTDWYEENHFPQSVTDDLDSAIQEVKHQISLNTQRSYKASFNIFHTYCEQHGLSALPADPRSIMAFIGFQKSQLNMSGHHLSLPTFNSRLAAIRFYHQQAGFVSPTEHPDVLKILRGLSRNQYRNTLTYNQQPIMYDELEVLISVIDQTENELIRLRDKSLILLGFQGGFRRSELSKIQVEHITFLPKKMKIRLPYSKSNQQGKSEWKLLPSSENYSAHNVLKDWLSVAGITSGHVFRSISRDGKSIRPYFVAPPKDSTVNHNKQKNSGYINGDDVYRIIKKYCNSAGFDHEFYGAHSLRSGCVTQLHENEKDYLYIMSRTGHSDPRSLKNYLKPKD